MVWSPRSLAATAGEEEKAAAAAETEERVGTPALAGRGPSAGTAALGCTPERVGVEEATGEEEKGEAGCFL